MGIVYLAKGIDMCSFTYKTVGVLLIIACFCPAAPEPAIVPGPQLWTVDVKFEHPQQIMMPASKNNRSGRFWYTIITLTNKADHDVDFYPESLLMTDTFQIIPAGKDVSLRVFEQIKHRHQSGYPFIEFLEKSNNRILQGADNTKDIAIIWPDFDDNAKSVKIFITGLSNETIAIDHPVAIDQMGKPKQVFLRKTLELSYQFGGDVAFRTDSKLRFQGKRWVMR